MAGLRLVLSALAASAAFPGAWAALAPRAFYEHFPGVSAWVAPLGSYNAHLVTDVGAFYLAFAALFAWAVWRPARELVLPLCAGWALFSVMHLAWHAAHTWPFGAADATAMLSSLALAVVLPGVAAVLARRRHTSLAREPSAPTRAGGGRAR